MPSQIGLFGDASACPRHGSGNVCDRCPEAHETDGAGFAHPSVLKGRVPLRECRLCKNMVPKDRWDTQAYSTCLGCRAKP